MIRRWRGMANAEAYSIAEWLPDGSGKPAAMVSKANESEDLKRTAGTNADGCTKADSPKPLHTCLHLSMFGDVEISGNIEAEINIAF
jgi:hypothetical protein